MFLIIQPKDFNKNFLMLSEKTKNNIMNDGYFYRLYYSDEYGTSKGLFLGFELQQVSIEKYFNKLKCGFNTTGKINALFYVTHPIISIELRGT